jgi:hypothetical protein
MTALEVFSIHEFHVKEDAIIIKLTSKSQGCDDFNHAMRSMVYIANHGAEINGSFSYTGDLGVDKTSDDELEKLIVK